MAEPFSAVPTSFLVRSGDRQWWGSCIRGALAILALLGVRHHHVAGGSRLKARAAAIVFLVVVALATLHPAGARHHGSHVVVPPGQPAPRVGPSYLYPDPETTPA